MKQSPSDSQATSILKKTRLQVETLVQNNPLLLACIEEARREEENEQLTFDEEHQDCDNEARTISAHSSLIRRI